MQTLTCDWLSSVGDVEVVGARLVRDVLHRAAAILVVHAGHLGLGGTLHCQPQATSASTTVERGEHTYTSQAK